LSVHNQNLSRPLLIVNTQGGQLKFDFDWPAGLINRFRFSLQASELAGGPFTSVVTPSPAWLGGNHFEIQAPTGSSATGFYRLTLQLMQ